jgi:hypothetical protein
MTQSSGTQISEKKPPAASGAEVIFLLLLVAFGMGLCSLVERNFNWYWTEPTEQRAFDTAPIKQKQEELTRLENKVKETEKQIDAAEVEQLKQQALAAKPQEETAKTYATLLTERIASLKTETEKIEQGLKLEKRMAADKLRGERRTFLLAKFATSILLPLIVVVVTFLVGAGLLSWVAGRRVWAIRGGRPVLLVAGVLLILLVYQVLEIAGAALIGIIVFLILLQRINWTPKVKRETG